MVIGGYDGILFQITQIITFVSCHKVKSMQKCISFWIKLEFNAFTFFCHVVLAFCIFEFDGKFHENLLVAEFGWAYFEEVAGINWIHSSLAGDSPPEHFEPNWRSVGACAILRQASKVLASMYWRSKIRGRNFGLKLKSYYANRP